jgi:hypothetical protein
MIDEDFGYKMYRAIAILVMCIIFAICVGALVLSSGCVTATKNIYHDMIATPEPMPLPPTPELTPTPTPTPAPTEDIRKFMTRTGGYDMREWKHWFRENANNFGEDLSVWTTIYGYKFMPLFHYHAISWGTHAFQLQKPDKDMQYLFIYVNMYIDGDDARPYGFDCWHYFAQVDDRFYYPDDTIDPSLYIKELDDIYNYAHVEGIGPYGYKRVQDLHTGIISVEELQNIYGGRSNAWDGYCIYQVPLNATANNTKIVGTFAGFGNAWWQLK